jgi:hypothetical protein
MRKMYNDQFHDLCSSPIDDIKKDEVTEACETYGGEGKYCIYRIWWRDLKKRDHLEDWAYLGVWN